MKEEDLLERLIELAGVLKLAEVRGHEQAARIAELEAEVAKLKSETRIVQVLDESGKRWSLVEVDGLAVEYHPLPCLYRWGQSVDSPLQQYNRTLNIWRETKNTNSSWARPLVRAMRELLGPPPWESKLEPESEPTLEDNVG